MNASQVSELAVYLQRVAYEEPINIWFHREGKYHELTPVVKLHFSACDKRRGWIDVEVTETIEVEGGARAWINTNIVALDIHQHTAAIQPETWLWRRPVAVSLPVSSGARIADMTVSTFSHKFVDLQYTITGPESNLVRYMSDYIAQTINNDTLVVSYGLYELRARPLFPPASDVMEWSRGGVTAFLPTMASTPSSKKAICKPKRSSLVNKCKKDIPGLINFIKSKNL